MYNNHKIYITVFFNKLIILFLLTVTVTFADNLNIEKIEGSKTINYFYIVFFKESNLDVAEINLLSLKKIFPDLDVENDKIILNRYSTKEKYSMLSEEYLSYYGRGIDKEKFNEISNFDSAIEVEVKINRDELLEYSKKSMQLVVEISKELKGVIYDDETNQVYSDSFLQHTIDLWKNKYPSALTTLYIDCFQENEKYYFTSMGMKKFGLPDIQTSSLTVKSGNDIVILIDLICQSLLEGNTFYLNEESELDLNKITDNILKEYVEAYSYENAKGSSKIRLIDISSKDEEKLYTLEFEESKEENQAELLHDIFGFEDPIVYIKHNKELKEASKRAREQIPRLKKIMKEKTDPNEYIMVKLPFEIPTGGDEWMWVEVTEFTDSKIIGILQNNAENIPDYKAGKKVEGNISEMFDYIHILSDGSYEGNETSRIIEKMNKH